MHLGELGWGLLEQIQFGLALGLGSLVAYWGAVPDVSCVCAFGYLKLLGYVTAERLSPFLTHHWGSHVVVFPQLQYLLINFQGNLFELIWQFLSSLILLAQVFYFRWFSDSLLNLQGLSLPKLLILLFIRGQTSTSWFVGWRLQMLFLVYFGRVEAKLLVICLTSRSQGIGFGWDCSCGEVEGSSWGFGFVLTGVLVFGEVFELVLFLEVVFLLGVVDIWNDLVFVSLHDRRDYFTGVEAIIDFCCVFIVGRSGWSLVGHEIVSFLFWFVNQGTCASFFWLFRL